ncbi:MAG: hypothetical protein M0036_03590 [Desulfobacteraceae bacterium]|nr:hypothetical protein [Desulfobacteraceae bacterium]
MDSTGMISIEGEKAFRFVDHFAHGAIMEMGENIKRGMSVNQIIEGFQGMKEIPPQIVSALVEMAKTVDRQVKGGKTFSADDWRCSPIYDPERMLCPCGCGVAEYDHGFLKNLEMAMGWAGEPFPIVEGYRCPRHDRAVHSLPAADGPYPETGSPHVNGSAMHIGIIDDHHRARVLYGLLKAGFNRIGLGTDFIHVDADDGPDKPANHMWLFCGGRMGSASQRFAMVKALMVDAGVMRIEIGRDSVSATTYIGLRDCVSLKL